MHAALCLVQLVELDRRQGLQTIALANANMCTFAVTEEPVLKQDASTLHRCVSNSLLPS